ncbi:unnamed protein product [Citrullus colocynthis]|uniref:Uncharacterized protein n=1 Tax=Citrullus colocynthis TaxID=252529 RepID=A0ABP0YGN0_9ROSI
MNVCSQSSGDPSVPTVPAPSRSHILQLGSFDAFCKGVMHQCSCLGRPKRNPIVAEALLRMKAYKAL